MLPTRRNLLGLAKAKRGQAWAFGALLGAAARDPRAAGGLAAAYVTLPEDVRLALGVAIAREETARHAVRAAALLTLLDTERDDGLRVELADHLRRLTTGAAAGEALPATHEAWAETAGDETRIVLRRSTGAGSTQWLSVVVVQSVLTRCEVSEGIPVESQAGFGGRVLMPVDVAVDQIAELAWRHRQATGALPSPLAGFADLFAAPRAQGSGHDG